MLIWRQKLIGGIATPLENMSQIGSSTQLLGKIKKCSKPPTSHKNGYIYEVMGLNNVECGILSSLPKPWLMRAPDLDLCWVRLLRSLFLTSCDRMGNFTGPKHGALPTSCGCQNQQIFGFNWSDHGKKNNLTINGGDTWNFTKKNRGVPMTRISSTLIIC